MTLGLEAAENLLVADPTAVASTLALLQAGARTAVGTVRAVVDGLRPPALDELGLTEAIRQHARALMAGTGTRIDVAVPQRLDHLPAAVEVAAYHITVQAMANAVHHAAATRITVSVATDARSIHLAVSDDGRGLPDQVRAGAHGLVSMRERAAELGGSLEIATGSDGTPVRARIPLRGSDG